VTAAEVTVLDYGTGNVHSACRALEHAGARVTLTADRKTALAAAGLVIPGVGAFQAVMSKLEAVGAESIIDSRLAAGRAVLGICVGMQVMFENGLEHGVDTSGLGQWPGTVRKLSAERLPHIGWAKVETEPESVLFRGVEQDYFYFVHSYAATEWTLEVNPPFQKPTVSWAEHGERFLAAVENGPLVATQFHPEKSGPAGLRLLQNWVEAL
jgi:glutamine amidotransferase